MGKDEEQAGVMVEDTNWRKGETYSYDELLQRLYARANPSLGNVDKYQMKPPQIVRVGSKKVGWVNFTEICNMMKRPPEHVMQFVLAEFGTEGSTAGDGQLILKGRYQDRHAESLLRKYIKEFVKCEMCKRCTNTTLKREASSRLFFVECADCGARRAATNIRTGYHAVTRADRRAAKNAA